MLSVPLSGKIGTAIYDVNQIWQVRDGKLACLKKDLGSASMTDPDTLSGYIQWCAANYPASRYELILWDHGGGSVSGYGYDEKFAASGSMDLAGLDAALRAGGVEFDFIGFDACLMATVETALAMAPYADYLIASEETEPGVGWYYTDWLTAFGQDASMPTIQIGRNIVDSFVEVCAQKCRGQSTTLSVVDLAHLAQNLGTKEGRALTDILLSAVKYNRTSADMANSYGLSIYFPSQKLSMVDRAASTYQRIGIDADYTRCIRQYASMAASGQAADWGILLSAVFLGTESPRPCFFDRINPAGLTCGIVHFLKTLCPYPPGW